MGSNLSYFDIFFVTSRAFSDHGTVHHFVFSENPHAEGVYQPVAPGRNMLALVDEQKEGHYLGAIKKGKTGTEEGRKKGELCVLCDPLLF